MAKRKSMARTAPGSSRDATRAGYWMHLMSQQQDWTYPAHPHRDVCEIVVLLHGELIQQFGDTTVHQHPGQLYLLRDGDTHALSGRDFSYANIMFKPSWLYRLESYTRIRGLVDQLLSPDLPPTATVPVSQRQSYHELIDELLHNHAHAYGRQVFANFLTLTVTRYLAPVIRTKIPAGTPEWLSRTVMWVHRQHEVLPTLAEIIKHSCRCKEHFTRQFSRWFGTSPSRYLGRLRIDRAAELLSTTNYPVQEIAHQAGFDNESYFYRLFARHKKMTPLAWRRRYGPRSIQAR